MLELILTGLDPAESPAQQVYFPAAQIKTIKQLHAFLVEHFHEYYTIDELSERFQISATVMKKCFHSVYDDSIYAYSSTYRNAVPGILCTFQAKRSGCSAERR